MSRWPTIRAILVTIHLVAITLSAVPSPEGGLNRSAWTDPTVQSEFHAWADRFGMPPKVFEDRIWDIANSYNRVLQVVLTPVEPYETLFGTEQSWKMFVAPHRFPTRLELSARAGDAPWDVLFYESSPTARWHESQLRLERLRSAIFRWGWPSYSAAFTKGCSALARMAFEEDAARTEFRCRFWRAESPSPAEAASGELPRGRWSDGRLVTRATGESRRMAKKELIDVPPPGARGEESP